MVPSFEDIVTDILAHPEFQKTRLLKHHGVDNSVYDHSVATALTAYRLSVRFGLEEKEIISATRAALLHDFFGYDWHEEWFRRFLSHYRGIRRLTHMHGFIHGHMAARRASRYFALTDTQRQAIAAHMFPLVPLMPRSREGWILTASDKIVATREMTQCVYRAARRILRRPLDA